ncbi:hypothetical protein, partial [Streptomyces sp. NPDC005167]
FTTEDGAVNAGGSLVLFDTQVAQQLYLKPGWGSSLSWTFIVGTDRSTMTPRGYHPRRAAAPSETT